MRISMRTVSAPSRAASPSSSSSMKGTLRNAYVSCVGERGASFRCFSASVAHLASPRMRYEKGATAEEAVPFVNPDQSELLVHATVEVSRGIFRGAYGTKCARSTPPHGSAYGMLHDCDLDLHHYSLVCLIMCLYYCIAILHALAYLSPIVPHAFDPGL
jgi:hypothetical protein